MWEFKPEDERECMEKVLAMILAGGRGRRMDIFCHERPKPALPFAGRFRVIDFSLSNCVHSQINDVAVLTDHQRSNMANYLGRWCSTNAKPDSFHILQPKSGSYMGTADAVYQNLDFVHRYGADVVLILAGDHVYKMGYHKMLAFHEHVKADVSVGVASVPIEQAHRFGIVTVDTEGRIVDFVEKPRIPKSNLASMGIYVFNRQVLAERLVEDATQPGSPHDFGYAIIPGMVNRDKVFAYEFDGYWQDIGNIEAYYEANMALTSQQPPFNLDGTWPILTEENDLVLPRESQPGTIKNSFVSPRCVVKGHVESSILSPGVCVEDRAVVRNSVLMASAFVGSHSIVEYCVLDEGVSIGEFCYIGVGTTTMPAKGEVTVLGKGVTVPSYTVISRNCKILPHARPADFGTNAIPGCYHFAAISASLRGALAKEER